MIDMEQAIKEIMSKIWEKGRELGMADEDIFKLIEKSLAEGIKVPANVSPTGEEVTYHQVKQSQPLYAPPTVTQRTVMKKEESVAEPFIPQPVYAPKTYPEYEVRQTPQPVYAPKTYEEYAVSPPQPLYAPPEMQEIHEMFKEETTGSGDQPKKI